MSAHIGPPAWHGAPVSSQRAPDVQPVPANAPRRPRRCRGAVAPAARPGRIHPACGAGRVLLASARLDRLPQRRADRPGGDGRGRFPGGPLPGTAAQGALRGDRSLRGLRRQLVPPPGSPRQRLPAGADARGDVHAPREGHRVVVQGPPTVDLPDPDEVPRRSPPAGGSAARPRVRDEGLVQLRHRRRCVHGVVSASPRRVREDLRPTRSPRGGRLRDVGRHGWVGVGRVPGTSGRGRGLVRPLHGV